MDKRKSRCKSKRNRILCILVICLIIMHSMLSLTAACAVDGQNEAVTETENCDTDSEDSEVEYPEEDPTNKPEENPNECSLDYSDTGKDEEEVEILPKEAEDQEITEELKVKDQEEDILEEGQEEYKDLRAEEDTEEKIPETANMPPPDDTEVLDAVEGNSTEEDAENEDENEEDTTEETGLLELTAESEDWAAILCSDFGLLFPEGSSLSVLPITKEEEETPETCQYLSELFLEEKSDGEYLIGFYEFRWKSPDCDFDMGELFLSFTLNTDEYADKSGRAWYLEEERFLLLEDAEAEKGTFYLPTVKQGIYALTIEDKEEQLLLLEDAKPEEKTEKDSEPEVYCAKAPPQTITEDIQEKKGKFEPDEEQSRQDLVEVGKDEDSAGPVRVSAAGAEVVPRYISLIHLETTDLADTAVSLAEFTIRDQNGNTVDTLTLSADNGWQTDWSHSDTEELNLTVVETALYDSIGNNVTDGWYSLPKLTENNPSYETTVGWAETDSFEIGTYVIAYLIEGSEYFLAAKNPEQSCISLGTIYGWNLTSAPDITDASIWNVIAVHSKYGATITNKAIDDTAYLSARQMKKKIFAVFKDDAPLRMQYENNILKAPAGTAYGFLRADTNGISCVESESEATQITLYRSVVFTNTVHESSVSFSHTEKPPPVLNTTLKVKLLVGGNMSERDRYFPFQVSVGGEEARTFSLSHKGEFVLNDIPIGSELMVSMEAPDYNIRASFNEDEETEDTLTVSSVPADGGTIVFRAEREAQLETGIRTRNRLCTTILIVIFLGLAMQPIIKYRLKPKYST